MSKSYIKSSSLKPKYKKLLIIAVILFVAIIVLETAASLFTSEPAWFSETTNTYGDVQVTLDSNSLKSQFYSIQSEPYFLTRNFYKQKQGEEKRIFIVGDDLVAGWPYTKNQSVGKKIEKILLKYNVKDKVELILISFAGFNSNYAVEFLSQLAEYKPDMVILFLGHNEFYTHEDLTPRIIGRYSNILSIINKWLLQSGLRKKIPYENSIDDLGLIISGESANQAIINTDSRYYDRIDKFESNISWIIEFCDSNGIDLVLPPLSDNLIIPPLGIIQNASESQADIIYNNARMAILRDGDITKAHELFYKSKELDAVKLRIPGDIKNFYVNTISDKTIVLRIDSLLNLHCESDIPSSKLFLDYVHPNVNGLNIIASTLAERIIRNLDEMVESISFDSILSFSNKSCTISNEDSVIAEIRLERAANKIANTNWSDTSK